MERKNVSFVLLLALLLMGADGRAQQRNFQDPGREARTNSSAQVASQSVEILSDTQGTDFGPYLSKQIPKIKANWYKYIPDQARAPQLESGETNIEFKILRDGRIAGMKLVHLNGNSIMDRAAWAGMIASNPFDPLPKDFKGDSLTLRIHFLYNPGRDDKQSLSAPKPADSKEAASVPH